MGRLALLCVLCCGLGGVASGGNDALVTQTVYGFLDFTTTMGNTVMVFSPQSAPPPESPKTEKSIQENIIETKPPPQEATGKPESIKPSKVSEVGANGTGSGGRGSSHAPGAVSSAVSVVSSAPKKEEKRINAPKSASGEGTQVVTKVEVVAGSSKVVGSSEPKKNTQTNKKPKTESLPNVVSSGLSSVTSVVSSRVEVRQGAGPSVGEPRVNEVVDKKPGVPRQEPAALVSSNNAAEPEYDFLSRQPSEFVEETYKVINIRPSKLPGQKPKHKIRPQPTPPPDDEERPLGLVTTLGGTIVKDGVTTVHETSVIGTYISGKYAQVLNSNSKILQSPGSKAKISPTSPNRILKTPAPGLPKSHKHNVELSSSINDDEPGSTKTTRKHSTNASRKHRPRSHEGSGGDGGGTGNGHTKKYRNRSSSHGVKSQSDAPTASYSGRRKTGRTKTTVTAASASEGQAKRNGFKPKVQATPVEHVTPTASTSIYKFKLNRVPGSGRWQYKTSPKPKVTIRKGSSEEEQSTTPMTNPLLEDVQANDLSTQSRGDNDLELSGSQNDPDTLYDNDADDNSIDRLPPVETLKVEISTPADFRDVYYEIATLKSPYTFQVGRVKNTRIVTVTTTIEKRIEPSASPEPRISLNEPLTENILATRSPFDRDHNLLESSIATLPPITLSSDMETPPLETVTETFSTTQNLLKTHLLPVVKEPNVTSTLTFTQTYHVTRFVTATKTLPPMEFYQFIPSKTLKEFNSHLDEAGSELHLELDFGDSNEEDEGSSRRVYLPDLDLANVGSDFDLTEVDKYRGGENHLRLKKAHGQSKSNHVTEPPTPLTPALSPEQAQQLALLKLLNPAVAAQIPDVLTTSKPVLKYETIYESHVIPFFDGKSTVQSTVSRIVATLTKTEYEIGTSSLPALPQLNPLFPQQFTVTSTPVVVNTEVVATDSQILKLTFGAKTLYTTLFSTRLVPTVVTSYVTTSVPVPPAPAGYPGFFPGPYAPFPYVG